MKAITDKLNKLMEERAEAGNSHVFVGSDTVGVIVDMYHGNTITEIFNKLYDDNKLKDEALEEFCIHDKILDTTDLIITEDDMKHVIKFESEYYYNMCNF